MSGNKDFVVQSLYKELVMQHERSLNMLQSMLNNCDSCTCEEGYYNKMSEAVGTIANLELKMSYMTKMFAKPQETIEEENKEDSTEE